MKSIKTVLPLLGLLFFSLLAYGQAGSFDSSFNSIGSAFFHFNGGRASASAVTVLPNGKILVVGTVVTGPGADSDFLLLRFKADGSLDPSFGNGGFKIYSWGGQDDIAKAMAVQSDGKILVAGWTVSNGKNYGLLYRFTEDGELDNSFNEDGIIYRGDELIDSPAMDIFITNSEKIIWCLAAKQHASVITRYLLNGDLDMSYGNGGQAFPQINSLKADHGAWAMLPEESVIAITSNYLIDDGIEPLDYYLNHLYEFSKDGESKYIWGAQVDGNYLNDAIIWDESIVVAEKTITKLNYKGKKETDFAFNGKQTAVPGITNALVSQIDGKLIAVGQDDDTSHQSIVIARLNLDGDFDKKFGENGKVVMSFSGSNNTAIAAALDSDERLLVVGQSGDSLFIARFLTAKMTPPPAIGVDSLFFQIRPNPVGAVLTIDYGLPTDGIFSLELMDLYGRQVQSFYNNATRQAGHYVEPIHVEGALPNGNYILRFRSQDFIELRKIMLLR